jgi:hypothetical protein
LKEIQRTAIGKEDINKLTKDIKVEIKKVRSEQWMKFLEKCHKTTSSRTFWAKIIQVRSGKTGGSIPTLKMDGMKFETSSEKAKVKVRQLNLNSAPRKGGIFNVMSENISISFIHILL